MAVSAETKLVKAKARIAALIGQISAHRVEKARLIAKVRGVVAGRITLERQLAGTRGTIKKLEDQLTRTGLTPVTRVV